MPKMKIMLLEDDPTMLRLLSRVLTLEGFSTILPIYDNRKDILQSILDEIPDAIFMDVYLGDINGLDLVGQIRANKSISKSKILMTSGMDLRHECQAASADGFLMKPFMPSDLVNWLKTNIEKEKK